MKWTTVAIRFTEDELKVLIDKAGSSSIPSYIKSTLFPIKVEVSLPAPVEKIPEITHSAFGKIAEDKDTPKDKPAAIEKEDPIVTVIKKVGYDTTAVVLPPAEEEYARINQMYIKAENIKDGPAILQIEENKRRKVHTR